MNRSFFQIVSDWVSSILLTFAISAAYMSVSLPLIAATPLPNPLMPFCQLVTVVGSIILGALVPMVMAHRSPRPGLGARLTTLGKLFGTVVLLSVGFDLLCVLLTLSDRL